MRTIKFRGRDENGKWWYGDLRHTMMVYGQAHIRIVDNGLEQLRLTEHWSDRINPETVGQFTGLIDKNGKEIYEGDILAWKSVVCEEDGVEIFFGKVTFTDGVFCVDEDWESSVERVLCDSEEYCIARVIGNIHDNPELLKGGAK